MNYLFTVDEIEYRVHLNVMLDLPDDVEDRKGRKVAPGDYVAIVTAVAETDRIMKEDCDPVFKRMIGV